MGTADEFKLSDFFLFCFVLKIDIDFPTIVDTKEMYGELPLMNIEATVLTNPSLDSQFGSVHDCLKSWVILQKY